MSKETQEAHLETISHCNTVDENLTLIMNEKELHELEIEQGMPTTMNDDQFASLEARYAETRKLKDGCESYFERYGR